MAYDSYTVKLIVSVCINEIADNLTLKAENPSTTYLGASSPNDSIKVPAPNKMYLLNPHVKSVLLKRHNFILKAMRNLSIARMIS